MNVLSDRGGFLQNWDLPDASTSQVERVEIRRSSQKSVREIVAVAHCSCVDTSTTRVILLALVVVSTVVCLFSNLLLSRRARLSASQLRRQEAHERAARREEVWNREFYRKTRGSTGPNDSLTLPQGVPLLFPPRSASQESSRLMSATTDTYSNFRFLRPRLWLGHGAYRTRSWEAIRQGEAQMPCLRWHSCTLL